MKIILACLLVSFAVLANAADTMTIKVNKTQSEFLITLPSNPTTGYQWTVVSFDKSLFTLKTSQFLPPKTKLIGAGGQMQFNFALIAGKTYPASTRMKFKYRRPWEPATGTLKIVRVEFQ